MRISDWSSDVCSSELQAGAARPQGAVDAERRAVVDLCQAAGEARVEKGRQLGKAVGSHREPRGHRMAAAVHQQTFLPRGDHRGAEIDARHRARRALADALLERHHQGRLAEAFLEAARSEEHTSELQSLMRISYAVFCFKKK